MGRRYVMLSWLSAVLWVLPAAPASAEVPKLIRYQGQAVDSQGVPLEGPHSLTFRLYEALTGGTTVWEETQANVPLVGGHFSVLLGQVTALTVDWSRPLWLSVQVNQNPELTPRQPITSVPLALVAERLAVPVTTSTITDDANRLVPPGAIILWEGASCPAGYTRLSAYDNYFLRASATAGTSGGSTTHDHGGVTGSHALTIDQMPRHRHVVSSGGGGSVDMDSVLGSANPDEGFTGNDNTDYTGGNQGHAHPIASVAHLPPFKTIALCKKD